MLPAMTPRATVYRQSRTHLVVAVALAALAASSCAGEALRWLGIRA